MIASNVSKSVLTAAAGDVGVRAEIEPLSESGLRHRVKLYPIVPGTAYSAHGRRYKGAKGDAKYQRESVGYGNAGRRVHAICWHGFRDYFRAVFAIEPAATFRTQLGTWKGAEDFEARFKASGQTNCGPPIAPIPMCAACRCPEAGTV